MWDIIRYHCFKAASQFGQLMYAYIIQRGETCVSVASFMASKGERAYLASAE